MIDPHVYVFDKISDLEGSGSTILDPLNAVYVRGYNSAEGRGGGLLRRSTTAGPRDGVLTFKAADNSKWVRDLNGGTLDAYMAGAYGDGQLDANLQITGTDDTVYIQRLFDAYRQSFYAPSASVKLHIRIGDGVFKVGVSTDPNFVGKGLDLTSFPHSPRGWLIDGTGATLLGGCADVPVIDFVDSRFGTVLNLQIVGAIPFGQGSGHLPSCGIRIGRKADNEAANQMVMDHVGTRGSFKVTGVLNVASEQHTSIACEYYNEAEGSRYGYAADAYNCL